jgi:hypothetical protein
MAAMVLAAEIHPTAGIVVACLTVVAASYRN